MATGCTSGSEETSTLYSAQCLTLVVPDGWSSTPFSSTNDPHRLTVASYPLLAESVEDDCGGSEAVDHLRRDGALVVVIDYGDRPGFGLRPDDLELSSGKFAHYECFGPSAAFLFRVGERDIQVHVAFGPDATADTKERALDVVCSIETES